MKKNFRIGDIVSFLLVDRRVNGVIAEDRGNLGIKGRHVFSVKVDYDSSDPMFFELQEGDFELLSSRRALAGT